MAAFELYALGKSMFIGLITFLVTLAIGLAIVWCWNNRTYLRDWVRWKRSRSSR